MNESDIDDIQGKYLFQHLVAMFQTLALQQLGKLINPVTGKLERDLHQAKITIDILQMIQTKTTGNLGDDEKRLIDKVLMELQMNYIDEKSRSEQDMSEGKKEEGEVSSGGSEETYDAGQQMSGSKTAEEAVSEPSGSSKEKPGRKTKRKTPAKASKAKGKKGAEEK